MLLKKIVIKNFKSYFKENVFRFGPDLTLIVGDNGDGKTSFFDALYWVFGNDKDLPAKELPSAKMLEELTEGEKEEVSVSLYFQHDSDYVLRRSFWVTKDHGQPVYNTTFNWVAEVELSDGSRLPTSASDLVNDIFDASIQEFCLFRGEEQLNVLSKRDALGKLLQKLSDIAEFDRYKEIVAKLAEDARKAFEKELSSDKKLQKKVSDLLLKKKVAEEKKAKRETELRRVGFELKKAKENVARLENNRQVWDEFNVLDKQQKQLQAEIKALENEVRVDLNRLVLDKLWILRDFNPIIDELETKAVDFHRRRGQLQSQWDQEQGEKIGRRKALEEFKSKLPWDVPDSSLLKQMIKDGRCEVCGRPVEEGSDAYKFMLAKLKEFEEHINANLKSEETSEKLFKHDYVSELFTRTTRLNSEGRAQVNRINVEIPEEVGVLESKKASLKRKREAFEKNEQSIENLLQRNHIHDREVYFGTDQAVFNTSYSAIGGFEEREKELKKEIVSIDDEISDIDFDIEELADRSSKVKPFELVKNVMDVINKAFIEGRETNADNFVKKLEDLSNKYLKNLSANDFHGTIRLQRSTSDEISIALIDSQQREVVAPSGAQKTSQYMAILFAIAELTQNKRQRAYPLIFDAPTSSFSSVREDNFYNIVNSLNHQYVILTKDLILADGSLDDDKVDQMNCWVYRIKKTAGFDKNNLASIQTEIIERKVGHA